MADQCEHNSKLRMLGVCAKCKEKKPYLQFRLCKAKCLVCKECGYFWGPDNEKMDGQHAVFTQSKINKLYTSTDVKVSLNTKYDIYYAKLSAGQSPRWSCDQRTKDVFCLSQWLMDELILLQCSDDDRRDVQNFFNRKARAEEDLYALAAKALNDYLGGNIERYRRIPRS